MTISRRSFLKTSAALTASAVASGRVLGANEALRVGVLGTGGRAQFLMKSLVKVPNVRIAAVCDVWDTHLDKGKQARRPKGVRDEGLQGSARPQGHRRRADRQPRPLARRHDRRRLCGRQGRVRREAAHAQPRRGQARDRGGQNKSKRIVQVGTQQRSMPHIQKAYELVRAGRLGTVHKVHLTWNRNTDRVRKNPLNIDPKGVDWKAFLGSAPKQEFDEYRFRNWRWFWDFGGGIFTDLMVHWIDVAHWILDLDHPTQAVALGIHTVSKGVWETPDTVQTLLTYGQRHAGRISRGRSATPATAP